MSKQIIDNERPDIKPTIYASDVSKVFRNDTPHRPCTDRSA